MSKAISYYDWSLDSKKKLSETSKCNNPDCRVLRCYSKKDVDFYFQCEEFPCNNTKFDDDLKTRWIQMNKKMKKIGVKRYFKKSRKHLDINEMRNTPLILKGLKSTLMV